MLLCAAHHEDRVHFRRELNRLYEIQDMEERDSQFRSLHSSWFARLKLGRPVEIALDERPIIARSTRCCLVAIAPRQRDECAELFVKEPDSHSISGHSVGLCLRPTTFLDPAYLLSLLRHEFLHIADMLDPSFEYEPTSPVGDDSMHPALIQERYRVLWDTTIDGRLVQEEMIAPSSRARRLKDFTQSFPMLGTRTVAVFARFFDGEGHTHPQLLAYALTPEAMVQDA